MCTRLCCVVAPVRLAEESTTGLCPVEIQQHLILFQVYVAVTLSLQRREMGTI